jgi:hypothetical protein
MLEVGDQPHTAAFHLERFPAELNRGFPIVCE